MKRPSLQFYPGDWRRDTPLQSCSLAARGLWLEMMNLMHDGNPYGHLRVGEKIIPPALLARMVGAEQKEVTTLLKELDQAGVFSKTKDGVIYSRRMVRDEEIRRKRAEGGERAKEHPNVPPVKPKEGHGEGPQKGYPSRVSFDPSLPASSGRSFGGSPASASASASASAPKKKEKDSFSSNGRAEKGSCRRRVHPEQEQFARACGLPAVPEAAPKKLCRKHWRELERSYAQSPTV